MKKLFLILLSFAALHGYAQFPTVVSSNKDNAVLNKINIGKITIQATDVNAWLEIGDTATTKALIIPRVPSLASIASPSYGMIVYNKTDNLVYFYKRGGGWISLGGAGGGISDTTALLRKGNNLADVVSVVQARINLGLGTAATLNVPASGNAATGEVVKGNDTRVLGAYISIVSLPDSSGFALVRNDGSKDTVLVLRNGATGTGSTANADSSVFATLYRIGVKLDSTMNHLFNNVNNAGKNAKIMAGVVYPTVNGVTGLNDLNFYRGTTNHGLIGFNSSINNGGLSFDITYPGVDSVVYFAVNADETMQKYGFIAGASVSTNTATVQASAPFRQSNYFFISDFTPANGFTFYLPGNVVKVTLDTINMYLQVDFSNNGQFDQTEPHVYAGNYYGGDGVNNILQRMGNVSTYVSQYKYPVNPTTGNKKHYYQCTTSDNFWIDYTYRGSVNFLNYPFPIGGNFWVMAIFFSKN